MWSYPWGILPSLTIEHDHVNSQPVYDFIPELFCHHWPLNMTMSIPRLYVILSLSYSATIDHWIWPGHWQSARGMWVSIWVILLPATELLCYLGYSISPWRCTVCKWFHTWPCQY
jgi:hypothetical protein